MRCFLTAATALVLALPCLALPDDLTIRAYIQPGGGQLHVLLRVPFKALSSVDFPFRGGNGELDLARTGSMLPSVARWWIGENIEIYEGDARLEKPQVAGARVSLPSDNSFASFAEARAHFASAQLANDAQVFRDQAMLDVSLEYPIRSDQSDFAMHSMLARLGTRVLTSLVFVPPGGMVRSFEYQGDPGLIRFEPRWRDAVRQFLPLGFSHILHGTDYLLLLFCVALLLATSRDLIPFVAAFVVAHSTTLIASAYNLASDALWFAPLIETLIAASVLYMAFENIAGGNIAPQRRWMLAFGVGLIFGFGFSFALLPKLQFAGSHVLASILSFNVGIDLGLVLALALMAAAVSLLFRFTTAQRMETIVLSALVADVAWHRATERAGWVSQFSFEWPVLNASLIANAMLWLTIFLVLGGLASLGWALYRHRAARAADSKALASSS